MIILVHIFLVLFLFVFQSTLLHGFSVMYVRPDMILILASYMGVRLGEENGAITGFLLGLVQDSLSSALFGANAFSKGVIGFIFGNLRDKIVYDNIFSQFIFVFIATVIDGAIILLIFFMTKPENAQVDVLMNKLLLQSIYTTLIGPLFLQALIFFNKKNAVRYDL